MLMLRRPRTLLVFLVLGAIVNVALAWGLAQRMRRLPMNLLRISDAPLTIISYGVGRIAISQEAPGSSPFLSMNRLKLVKEDAYQTLVPQWSAFYRNEPALQPLAADQVMDGFTEESCGWPMYALCGTKMTWSSLDFQIITIRRRWQLSIGSHFALPLRPIWPGFAINTLFYASILWLLFAAPFALRRRRRIKRGLCPACAYPISARDVCTECGRPLRPEILPARQV